MIHSIATRKITAFLFAMASLALVGQGTSYSQPPIAEGKIYWTDPTRGIQRANLDGTDVEQIVESDVRRPADIALDLLRGKIYWTDGSGIYYSDLDGSNLKPFIDVPIDEFGWYDDNTWVAGVTNIALDVDGGKIYWTEAGTIQRADLDGQNIEEVLTDLDGHPEEITLDVDRGKVYWTNPVTQTIQRADLNGSNVEILFNLEGDVLYTGWPSAPPRIGIGLDVDGGKIYWAGSWSGKIQRANLDGKNIEVLFDPIAREPHGIALYLDKIYWTDWMKGTIQRADLDGKNIEVLIAGLKRPMDIALLAGDKIYWTEETGRKLDIRRYGAGLEIGKIQQANLDGSNVKEVLTDLSNLEDIALDVVRDKIYWSERFHTIQQANLDGSNVEPIVSGSTDSYNTGKMALDVLAGKIYWISAFNGIFNSVIQRANLDGSNVEPIVTIPPEREHWDHYEAFALDQIGNKIYGAIQTSTFSSSEGAYRTGTEFSRSNLDGSNIEKMWRPSFNWWEIPPATTDIALDLSHPTSISTPATTPTIPTTSSLSPNFPNPFNASTQITYDIATPGPVRLTIYNILGQPVRTLVDQSQPAGFYQVRWDARDQRGTALAAGVYLVHLHYPGGEQTRRLLLLK